MALHGEIRVNGMVIGEWEAQRQTEHQPEPDDVVHYWAMARQNSTPDGCPAFLERFEVEHRFGDGALALAARVLDKAATLQKMQGGTK